MPRLQNGVSGLRGVANFVLIVLVPLMLLIWRSVATGRWRTVDASDKKDRPILYFVAFVSSATGAMYFHRVEGWSDVAQGCIVAAIILVVAAALNRWIKISLHLACACFCGIIFMQRHWVYGLPLVVLLPALVWSRLVLSRHVLAETMAGAALGILGALGLLWFNAPRLNHSMESTAAANLSLIDQP
jgi:hypothetical protein